MSISVPLYGFGASGGTGGTLTVTTPGAGITITAAKDGKTKTKVSGADGTAVFKGLDTGTWTLSITDGEQTAQKTVTVTTDYATAITFFAATIHVTYPAGSTCTATCGLTTLIAPDTSGTWECVVQNAGTWTITCTKGSSSVTEDVVIETSGQIETIYPGYLFYYSKQNYSWSPKGMKKSNYYPQTAQAPTATQNDDGSVTLTMPKSTSSMHYRGGYICNQAIDFTDLSSITMMWEVTSDGSIESGLNILPVNSTYYGGNVASVEIFSGTNGVAELTLDVSGLSGTYELFISIFTLSNITVTVKEISCL